jgi:hypothetical protein
MPEKKRFTELNKMETELCIRLANNFQQETCDAVELFLDSVDFDLLLKLAENYVWFGSTDVTRSLPFTVQLDGHFSPSELKLIATLAEKVSHA